MPKPRPPTDKQREVLEKIVRTDWTISKGLRKEMLFITSTGASVDASFTSQLLRRLRERNYVAPAGRSDSGSTLWSITAAGRRAVEETR